MSRSVETLGSCGVEETGSVSSLVKTAVFEPHNRRAYNLTQALQQLADPPHAVLRRETQPLHTTVEQAFSFYDLGTKDGYAAFLTAQAAAVCPLEQQLEDRGAERLVSDWAVRRRSVSLLADLRALGREPPDEGRCPDLSTSGRQLGALYVLEGSRLGGSILAREVARSSDPAVRSATSFLDHEAGPRAWTRFRECLNEAAAPVDELLWGAEQAFGCFLDAARKYRPATACGMPPEQAHLPHRPAP